MLLLQHKVTGYFIGYLTGYNEAYTLMRDVKVRNRLFAKKGRGGKDEKIIFSHVGFCCACWVTDRLPREETSTRGYCWL
ncbi:MAG: hypothetical protein HFH70_10400 [Lachnospiraceae bacterium]|nr:hypothetical protein [Lachnospiraceae bacterium]